MDREFSSVPNRTGSAGTVHIRIQAELFSIGAETQALADAGLDVGAVVAFTGLVRDLNLGDRVARLELEHYPGMTERSIAGIVAAAERRWQLLAVRVVHRIGPLDPGDPIVFVGTASAHRGDAFAACEFIMDYLKTQAPLWKKETTPDGERWVDARASDADAASRWE